MTAVSNRRPILSLGSPSPIYSTLNHKSASLPLPVQVSLDQRIRNARLCVPAGLTVVMILGVILMVGEGSSNVSGFMAVPRAVTTNRIVMETSPRGLESNQKARPSFHARPTYSTVSEDRVKGTSGMSAVPMTLKGGSLKSDAPQTHLHSDATTEPSMWPATRPLVGFSMALGSAAILLGMALSSWLNKGQTQLSKIQNQRPRRYAMQATAGDEEIYVVHINPSINGYAVKLRSGEWHTIHDETRKFEDNEEAFPVRVEEIRPDLPEGYGDKLRLGPDAFDELQADLELTFGDTSIYFKWIGEGSMSAKDVTDKLRAQATAIDEMVAKGWMFAGVQDGYARLACPVEYHEEA